MAVVVSAVVTAFEVGTVAAALTAVAEVGLACTVVGAATGSKDLMKAGKVLGIVGGIGSLANAAFGSLTEAAVDGVASGAVDSAVDATADNLVNAATDATGEAIADGLAQTAPVDLSGLAATDSAAGALPAAAESATPAAFDSSLQGMAENAASDAIVQPAASQGYAPIQSAAKSAADSASNEIPWVDYGEPLDKYLNTGNNVGANVAAGTKSPFDQFVSKMGDTWDKLGPTAKAEVAKSLLAIPGGIQKQKNDERMLKIQQQNADANTARVGQTSYGNQVVGIINKAKAG